MYAQHYCFCINSKTSATISTELQWESPKSFNCVFTIVIVSSNDRLVITSVYHCPQWNAALLKNDALRLLQCDRLKKQWQGSGWFSNVFSLVKRSRVLEMCNAVTDSWSQRIWSIIRDVSQNGNDAKFG